MIQTDQKYWNMDVEPLLNTPEIRESQKGMLPRAIRYCYENVPFERRRMDATGVKPEDIRSFDDFQRALKSVGQAEFRQVFEEFELERLRSAGHRGVPDRPDGEAAQGRAATQAQGGVWRDHPGGKFARA